MVGETIRCLGILPGSVFVQAKVGAGRACLCGMYRARIRAPEATVAGGKNRYRYHHLNEAEAADACA